MHLIQLLLIAAALILWSAWPEPAFWALIAAYGIAWLVADRLTPANFASWRPAARPRALLILAGLAVIAAPLLALYRQGEELADAEGLIGLGDHLTDRLRLEALPAVAPPIVFADHPQRFYLYAPGARTADLRLDTDLPALAGEDLGHGLFRVDFDPRRDAVPAHQRARLDAAIVVDGRTHARALGWLRPQPHPRWLASAPTRGLAATVSEETDEVILIDRQDLRWRAGVGDAPTDVVFIDGGTRLVVSHRHSPALFVLDSVDGAIVERIDMPRFQSRLAVSPTGGRIAVAIAGTRPSLEILDLEAPARRSRIALEHAADWLAFGASGDLLVAATRADRRLQRFERRAPDGDAPAAWHATASLDLGRPVVTLGRHPGGHQVVLAITDEQASGAHRGNHFIQDQLLTVDVASLTIVQRLLTGRRTPRQDQPGSIDSGASPIGIAVRPDGELLVAFAGSEEVWRIDAAAGAPRAVIRDLDLDLVSPHGVADLGEGYWAATSPAGGALAIYGPDDAMVSFIGVAPADDELAAAPAGSLAALDLDLRAGERAFFEATRSGIACQSCHLHADTDDSPHDIGQVPLLPTLSVRGIAGTAPYLRDASFPRIRDLDRHLAGSLYRGYARDLPNRGLLLERYVASLPRAVNPRHFEKGDPAALRAGMDAFVAGRCLLCHRPPAFSHLGQHPARALFPDYGAGLPAGSQLDTPSLLGVHTRSHFLQDGRAASLDAVFGEHNEANRHGDTARLGPVERAALARFLESL